MIEKIKRGFEEMLALDHDALLESQLDRNEMLAEIAEEDEELEYQFTELEQIIAQLERQ